MTTSPTRPRTPLSRREKRLLLAILALALALRLFRIDAQSLWYDEAYTIDRSARPFGAMIDQVVADAFHPPLHFALLHGWLEVFGVGALQARLLSALCGTLAVGAIFLLARELHDARTGLVAALLLSLSQMAVAQSQEAKPYALLALLHLLCLLAFARAWREPSPRRWWTFVLSAAVLLHAHYYAALALAALALVLALSRASHRIPAAWILGGAAALALLLLPWLSTGVLGSALSQSGYQLRGQPEWFAVDWKTPLRTLGDFDGARIAGLLFRAPAWAHAAGALLLALPALLGLRGGRDAALLLGASAILPVATAIALGLWNVQYDPRYVAFALAPYLVLAARGLSLAPGHAVRALLLAAIGLWSVLGLRAVYTIPSKENWRDALAWMAGEWREGDAALFLPFEKPPLEWAIYHPSGPAIRAVTTEDVATGRVLCERLWVIAYERVPGAQAASRAARERIAERYEPVDERPLFWITPSLWRPRGER